MAVPSTNPHPQYHSPAAPAQLTPTNDQEIVEIQPSTAEDASVLQDPQLDNAAITTEQTRVSATEVYSVFSPRRKKFIVLTASTAAFFSPLSSNIYLPALNILARDLSVSDSQINLTVTTYLIFQALSPLVIAGFSDNAGRRPAYIVCFGLYVSANLGLALQHSYPALMVLRCLQSAGSSGTVALCQGVVSDVATSAERGTYVAYASVSTILGPTLSPVIGGLLSQYLGWQAIFWFLVVFAVPVFLLLLVFFPETARSVVGNGSIPPKGLNRSLVDYIREKKERRAHRQEGTTASDGCEPPSRAAILAKFPNPLRTLVVFKDKGTALLMLYIGLLLAVHYIILAAIPTEYEQIYRLDQIRIALVYLPYGFGSALSAFTTGRLVNWNYRRHAKRLDFPMVLNKQVDLSNFPIERARIEIALPLLYFGSALIVVYGWLLNSQVHLAGPLVLLFFIGWSVFAIYQVTSILVIDIYPEKPATATAANNLVRCLFSAGATAVVIPMLERLGRGWTYTLTSLLFVALSPMLFVLMRYGPGWRRQKKVQKGEKGQHPVPN
ncbi:hypothetical protein SLS62_007476 [Diatrype stigma]|uniref:Major facilitator superfamily (MFS) profile domain-containing protein n=1 Tax=Diatrype stigma TaxID=117547 RepID=A0AAN9UWR0_9PEZI